MSLGTYGQQKSEVVEKYLPWIENGLNASANKAFEVTVDWRGFDRLVSEDGVAAVNKLMEMIRTIGPIIRGMLVAQSHEQRQLVRTRIDGLRFEYDTDIQQELVSNDGNTLVCKVLAGMGAASRDDLWTAEDVLYTMPESPNTVPGESPFDFWKINVTSLVLPELQNKLSELSGKELTVDMDWESFSGYQNAANPDEIRKQFQELVRRVQFTIRGMLFTGGPEERQLIQSRVDGIRFGHATDEKQPVLASAGNTLVFLLSMDGKPIEKDHLFFHLPEVVKAMP